MDSKIITTNLQAMSLNSKSLHSPQRSSSPEFYHSYKSNDGHTLLTPNTVCVLKPVLKSEDNVLATPEASGAAQDREGESKAQQEENCWRAPEAKFAASTLSCFLLTHSPVRIMPAPLQHGSNNFKPVNLPKFDGKSNVAMFLHLYQNSMYGTDNAMRDSTIINCLDAETQIIILPHLPEND
ncbi:hypothetical protein DSO57_1027539 [Entomophthora muscae]|uniref:Uncharacterized protein n=1 Tax=Entomophthora muscae TaxID=34485 RepID=A0ACC2RSM7_9FUNG|nr:hypothetical protein DSO57_1027539 [Entomophthora muscae]